MWDLTLKKQLKGNALEACIVTFCIYGLGTLTLRQKEMIQIAQHNWVRRICKAAQEDRRKMKELVEEIGKKKHLKMKLVGSRMRWAGQVQRLDENKLSKEHGKQKGVAEKEDENQICDGKTNGNLERAGT